MAAYAEGLNVIANADMGKRQRDMDAETAPLEHPELYQYEIDTTEVAEVWRRGSVVGSWLLDLTAAALHDSPTLEEFAGRVSDSGEGRWTSIAAIEEGVPAPVLTDGALLALRLAQHGRLRQPAAVRDAQAVRRPRREGGLMPLEVEVLAGRGRSRRARRRDRRRGGGRRGRRARAIHVRRLRRAHAVGDVREPLRAHAVGEGHDLPGRRAHRARRRSRPQSHAAPAQPAARRGRRRPRRCPSGRDDLDAAAALYADALPGAARSRPPRARPGRTHRLARARRSRPRTSGSRRRASPASTRVGGA